ncbi:guanine nucleotide binding protein, alpha subunit [Metschnikowia bicuspidata var. bicuspidata NRRL YB-4993]|uniref:Guanine nucleotide binding protein, alpha subunit n=1 Tax=Metschnikowia bicuspidata var. bicuspidata NRRL YB-4993 TaxID=869754 RepID=A0A1A0H804_9ASCO|nr:guanine nucleotide binding protein, alpha subunit [Metschnikowia bicuspidata var. bicuspidata NRRL YB-4993]OBA20022.1 guanine nucleotide binding protein, alpha subunit [Metschnikowia bicuspidata var. bicuspidata NRRL YB-4993]
MGSCTSKEHPTAEGTTLSTTLSKRAQQNTHLKSQTPKHDSVNGTKSKASANGSNAVAGTHKDAESSSNLEQNGTTNGNSLQANNSSLVQTNEKDVKILLLGSGESGKSTIVKQMKIIHKDGFSDAEAYDYRPFVYKNVMDCIKNIINAIIDLAPEFVAPEGSRPSADTTQEKTPFLAHEDLQAILDYENSINAEEPFKPDIASKIATIYSSQRVRDFIKHNQAKFYLIDSSDYFLSAMDRISEADYVPSQADILRTRKKTSGIFDFRFQMGNSNIHMFDVGGQRSERKKWIHCFDNVTLIIFCVALSEYDQVLLEESSQNRLEESLTLFDSVVNSRWFSRTSVVLFLNKIDVFANKLPNSPLENHFPDYNGGDNLNKAVKYILWRFTQVNRPGLNIYPHVTQATDTSNIQLVFTALKETILENSLRDSGIL